MARKKLPWLRLYTELTKDTKLRRRPVAERWVWISVLCLAGESPIRGTLLITEGTPATLHDIADDANVPLRTVRKAIDGFLHDDMLSTDLDTDAWVVTKWDERQFESDVNAADRSRKHRQRKAKGS